MNAYARRCLNEFGLFGVLLSLRIGLSLWLLGGVYARVHDNLDSVVVYNIVAGAFWASVFDPSVFDVFIGGASRWYHFTQSFSPQTLPYAILRPGTAYLITEVMGLALAFWGMLQLLRELFGNRPVLKVLACFFAFSISFHSYGLGLVGAPVVLWLAVRQAPIGAFGLFAAFLIGLSSALVLHGLFVPFVFLSVCLMLRLRIQVAQSFAVIGIFLLGCVIASSGLLYATIFGPPSHRTEWSSQLLAPSLFEFFGELTKDVLTLDGQYHAIFSPGIFAAFFILAGAISGKWRAVFWSVAMIALASTISVGRSFYVDLLPSSLATIQFNRLGLFGGLVMVLLAGLVMASDSNRPSRVFCWIGIALYGLVVLTKNIGLNEETLFDTVDDDLRARGEQVLLERDFVRFFSAEFFGGEGISRQSLRSANQTFATHFRQSTYSCFSAALPEGSRVFSIGIDPMIAPMNGIAAIDGYHNFYPLEYKERFRPIVAAQIEGHDRNYWYFEGWGSRLISFVEDPADIRIDLTAAAAVGATHLISAFDLSQSAISDGIVPVATDCSAEDSPRLYRLVGPEN